MGTYIFVMLQALLFSATASAQTVQPIRVPIDPEQLFVRCYEMLTGSRPETSNPRYEAVIQARDNGQNIAIDECETLLNETMFDVDTVGVTGFPNTPSDETYAVLNQMLRMFMNFFENNNMETRPQGQVVFGETRFYTGIEGAEYLTELLFNPQNDFTDFTRGTHSVRSVRTNRASNSEKHNGFYYLLPILGNFSIFSRALERGPLRGLVRRTPTQNGQYIDLNGTAHSSFELFLGVGNPLASELQTSPPQPAEPPYTFAEATTGEFRSKYAWGGGLFGQSGYIISNHGFNSHNEKSDGGFKVPRRLMHRIFKDAFCIEEAPLRTTDVVQEVAEYQVQFPNGDLPFRSSTACTSCHASFDRGPYDNFYTALTAKAGFSLNPAFTPTTLITRFPIDSGRWIRDNTGRLEGAEFDLDASVALPRNPTPPHLIEGDDPYFLRPDDFDLRYRDFAGNYHFYRVLVEPGQDAIEEFGKLLEDQDQIYVCMAKKMVNYFWGKNISVMDPGDNRNPQLTFSDQYYKDEIIALGLDFKNHRSLKQLMMDIMRSPIYSNSGLLGFK